MGRIAKIRRKRPQLHGMIPPDHKGYLEGTSSGIEPPYPKHIYEDPHSCKGGFHSTGD